MSTQPANTEMVNIEVDGKPMEVAKNSMIIEATDKAGISVPRFCYHSKLSIAANCRMCLVDVEKAPKPMPACATPVMEGMKVFTHSRRAIDAQHGVMEFLLINHPLDCPICDQGGECELQDQAVGYGRSVSRFVERKRVVKDNDIGPLVQTDLTRCIQCTRCVRFLEEIAGTSELGMFGRGDRVSIGASIEQGIESELSGNVIDLCPVGALTNKPFRYSARAWELMAKASIAMHDGVGSNMWYHTRRNTVMRAVPRDNEPTNETWLSDRDRYSHFGLTSDTRVLEPMVKTDGNWQTVSWDEAIVAATTALQSVVSNHGPEQLAVLMSGSAATEEYYLAQRLARGLGSNNIDYRLREVDFSDDSACTLAASFETSMESIDSADVIMLIGSNIRHEAPILGQRVRKAWKNGAKIAALNPLDWNFHFSLTSSNIAAPQNMVAELAGIAKAVADATGTALPASLAAAVEDSAPSDSHKATAAVLTLEGNKMLLLGQAALAHEQAAWLRQLAGWVANTTGAALNTVSFGGNASGAAMAGALPNQGPAGAHVQAGLDSRQALAANCKGYLLWNVEPQFDIANPSLAMGAFAAAEQVVAIAAFADESLRASADIILPLAPLAESGGLFYSFDGQAQSVEPANKACGQAKPGWKILRRLGAELGLDGFEQVDNASLRQEMLAEIADTKASSSAIELPLPPSNDALYRCGELAMYSVDALCRNSEFLQQTPLAQNDYIGLSSQDAATLGLSDGDHAIARQANGAATLPVVICDELPAGGVWLKAGIQMTGTLGDSYGPISVEAAK